MQRTEMTLEIFLPNKPPSCEGLGQTNVSNYILPCEVPSAAECCSSLPALEGWVWGGLHSSVESPALQLGNGVCVHADAKGAGWIDVLKGPLGKVGGLFWAKGLMWCETYFDLSLKAQQICHFRGGFMHGDGCEPQAVEWDFQGNSPQCASG